MKLTVANKNYGLVEFYDEVATQLGYDKDKVEYDCTKICVAENIQDNFFAFSVIGKVIFIFFIIQQPGKCGFGKDTFAGGFVYSPGQFVQGLKGYFIVQPGLFIILRNIVKVQYL